MPARPSTPITAGPTAWPSLLANAATAQVAVVNAGIGGNCLLRDFIGPRALDRFERDVLDQPGVAWVIIHEGINDIGLSTIFGQLVSAEQLIAGYLELIDQAYAEAPARLLEAYDSGDHLHPNDAGYAAMADAIDLTLLE